MHTEYIAHYLGDEKVPQPVAEHLEETSKLASLFAGKIGLSSLGKLEGLLHDVGKYSSDFQTYIRSKEGKKNPDEETAEPRKKRGEVDHSSAGAQLVWGAPGDNSGLPRLFRQMIALCVASHHSGLIDNLSPDGEDKFSTRITKSWAKTHLEEVKNKAEPEIIQEVEALLNSSLCVEELTKQLEKLLSADDSPEIREFYVGLLVRFLFSALIDADRLSAAGRTGETGQRPEEPWAKLVERLERHLDGLEQKNWVDKIRAEVSLACREFASRGKGLYKLTVPTGGGKTLSSLRFGLHHAQQHRMDRLIYVIPYTSIIDQNASRARSILEDATKGDGMIVLEHHSNLTPDKQTWENTILSENWDAPVIFTTMVQFLDALFAGRTRGVRRMHRLANSVIIFDEIQTLPIRTVHLFNNAVNFLVKECGSTVVFCTATQPLLDNVDKARGVAILSTDPEMVPHHEYLFEQLRRVSVVDKRKVGGWDKTEIAELACQQGNETGSTLVVVNTKADAKAIYELCHQRTTNVFHLSTNMCPAHRMRIIWSLKRKLARSGKQSEPFVCVSTQLIEAGVDLDFGAVIRYLAGLNSIGQAAGRCNRNGRRPAGTVTIVNPSGENLTRLPEIAKGREIAERVLDEYHANPYAFDNNLLSPKAMRRYYEYYFYERSRQMVYPVSAKEIGRDDNLLSLLSTNELSVQAYAGKRNSAPPIHLTQSFGSSGSVFEVIDAPTEGIIIPYSRKGIRIINELCAVQDLEETRRLLRKAQRYSVNIFPYEMEKLAREHCIHETQPHSDIFYLDTQFYDPKDLGILFDDRLDMRFLNG